MVKIGEYELLMSETLLVPEGDTVEIEYDDGKGNDFKVLIRFEDDLNLTNDKGKPKPLFNVEPHGDCGLLLFKNWKSTLGASFKDPVEFARLDSGSKLSLLAQVSFTGELYRATIQMMAKGGRK